MLTKKSNQIQNLNVTTLKIKGPDFMRKVAIIKANEVPWKFWFL